MWKKVGDTQQLLSLSVAYSHNKYAYIHIYIYMLIHTYTYICWIHTDAINKDAVTKMQEGRKTSLTIFYLSLYCKGSKGLFKGCL